MDNIIGIYKITSPTGNIYIGQSWNIASRWLGHKYPRGKTAISSSIKKHGCDSHKFEIIHKLPVDVTQKTMDDYEIIYIKFYKDAGFKLLNGTSGGMGKKGCPSWNKGLKGMGICKGVKGRIVSEATKAKLRLANLGRKSWNTGRKSGTPAWNKGLKGVCILSAESRKKISDKNKGKQNSLGRKMNEKTRLAIRASNIGKKRSPEHIAKIARGKMLAPPGGLKNRGKIRTEENKRRISESLKARQDNKGEFHNMAKLTALQVMDIRNKYIPFNYTSGMLAKEYNVSKTNIKDIIKKRIWKNI